MITKQQSHASSAGESAYLHGEFGEVARVEVVAESLAALVVADVLSSEQQSSHHGAKVLLLDVVLGDQLGGNPVTDGNRVVLLHVQQQHA